MYPVQMLERSPWSCFFTFQCKERIFHKSTSDNPSKSLRFHKCTIPQSTVSSHFMTNGAHSTKVPGTFHKCSGQLWPSFRLTRARIEDSLAAKWRSTARSEKAAFTQWQVWRSHDNEYYVQPQTATASKVRPDEPPSLNLLFIFDKPQCLLWLNDRPLEGKVTWDVWTAPEHILHKCTMESTHVPVKSTYVPCHSTNVPP